MSSTRPDPVSQALETAILSGKLKPRQRLIETELAAEMNVGRFAIRRAISELAAKGLVETVPQKGARVIDVSDEEVEGAYHIRLNLELLCAELVVKRISRDDLAEIKRLQKEYVRTVERHSFEEMVLKNEEFHRALYAASRNKLLCDLLEKVRNVTFPLRYSAYFIPGRSEQSIRDHVAMIDALEKKDLTALTQVITQSILYPKSIYLSRKRQNDPSRKRIDEQDDAQRAQLNHRKMRAVGSVARRKA